MSRNKTNAELRANMAREYLAERKARKPNVTPSRTYVNATIREPYTGNNMSSPRAEADQHKQYTGAGFRAQIERVTS